jgi:hypothetical protein
MWRADNGVDAVPGFLAILLMVLAEGQELPDSNWCRAGAVVMIPDGREGPVISADGELCKVLAYGEKYVSLWPHYLLEPADADILGLAGVLSEQLKRIAVQVQSRAAGYGL